MPLLRTRKIPFLLLCLFCSLAGCDRSVTSDYLATQEGQKVKFTAKVSSHVEQHPTGQMDTLNPETNQPVRKHETYVSISDGAQIVVASDVPINCQESIEVEGVVRIVETTPGSKGKNYRRPWIYVGSFRCL